MLGTSHPNALFQCKDQASAFDRSSLHLKMTDIFVLRQIKKQDTRKILKVPVRNRPDNRKTADTKENGTE